MNAVRITVRQSRTFLLTSAASALDVTQMHYEVRPALLLNARRTSATAIRFQFCQAATIIVGNAQLSSVTLLRVQLTAMLLLGGEPGTRHFELCQMALAICIPLTLHHIMHHHPPDGGTAKSRLGEWIQLDISTPLHAPRLRC